MQDRNLTTVMRQARAALDSATGNINPERSYCDEIEDAISEAIAALSKALEGASVQAAPAAALTEQQAHHLGAYGAEPTEAERLLFEAWMRGHCWAVVGDWTGTTYQHPQETSGFVHGGAMDTRRLWAAWRDRAALSQLQQATAIWNL